MDAGGIGGVMTWRQRLAILSALARALFALAAFRDGAAISAATARLEQAMEMKEPSR